MSSFAGAHRSQYGRGVFVSLRTRLRKDNIFYKQSVWEPRKSDVKFCRRAQVCWCFLIALKYVQFAFT